MFKKILLPIDLSDRHDQALRLAVDLARASGGEVVLLHVVEVIAGLPGEEEFYGRLPARRPQAPGTPASVPGGATGVPRLEVVLGSRQKLEIVRHAQEASVVLAAPLSPCRESIRTTCRLDWAVLATR